MTRSEARSRRSASSTSGSRGRAGTRSSTRSSARTAVDGRRALRRVGAERARASSVVGDFNDWDAGRRPARPGRRDRDLGGRRRRARRVGQRYKFHRSTAREKADPVAFEAEVPPKTASVVFESAHEWRDADWLAQRARAASRSSEPMSIYEVHAPSWRQGARLARARRRSSPPYVRDLGFTHVELLPVMQHPFSGSWGYQVTGYYAPLSHARLARRLPRTSSTTCTRAGIGVILDWVPAHFPRDDWALARFDGTALYEHADPRRGAHPDWGTLVFNLGRTEVRNFLLANALFWLREYHADGLRVDAVASMLYLDYSRKAGEWVPNEFGGREDLEAVAFLQELNELVHAREPGRASRPPRSRPRGRASRARPTSAGSASASSGTWAGCTTRSAYFAARPGPPPLPPPRADVQLVYACNENFILPLSHDEVVHGKGSLLAKMPGDRWQQLANLRALYALHVGAPGQEAPLHGRRARAGRGSGATRRAAVDWHLLEHAEHAGVRALVRDLNRVYRDEPALWELDFRPERLPLARAERRARTTSLAFVRAVDGRRAPARLRRNLSPVAARGLPRRPAARRRAGRAAEHRLGALRRLGGVGERRRGRRRGPRPGTASRTRRELTLPPLAVVWLVPERAA